MVSVEYWYFESIVDAPVLHRGKSLRVCVSRPNIYVASSLNPVGVADSTQDRAADKQKDAEPCSPLTA